GSSNAAQGQVNRHDLVLPSRTVADNALGEPSAAPHTAAALQQQPRKQYGTDAPLSSQVFVDDLGVEDVDEFEAELAAVQNAKFA
ncbi:hypothetical protein MMC14_009989, partial [Varicellaria rhodocarpa]|nr:hypothetical protein [Varicellaria rhodocarpa]